MVRRNNGARSGALQSPRPHRQALLRARRSNRSFRSAALDRQSLCQKPIRPPNLRQLAFMAALLLYRKRSPIPIVLCLFAIFPLYSGLSHWFECDQRGHMFGYWFGHDMFKPPFKGADGKLLFPEITRDAILFGGTDPGRFCPTYMVFCESFTPLRRQPREYQTYARRYVYIIPKTAPAPPPYLNHLRAR